MSVGSWQEKIDSHRNFSFDRVGAGVLVQESNGGVMRRVLLVIGYQRCPQSSVHRRVGLEPAKRSVVVWFLWVNKGGQVARVLNLS